MSEEVKVFEDIDVISDALKFAAFRHQGQMRKDGKRPYVTHVKRAAEVLWQTGEIRDSETIVAALLHDTIEDTNTTQEELKERFGERVASIVMEVTDDKSLPKEKRKELQIEHAPHLSKEAKLIKIADKISNIEDILDNPPLWPSDRKKKYVEWAVRVIAGARGVNAALEKYFDELCEKAHTALNSSSVQSQ